MVCFDDLGLRPSGKRSWPMMEEKIVLLQSTPGSDEIGNHSTGTVEGGQARESSSIIGVKSFPEPFGAR